MAPKSFFAQIKAANKLTETSLRYVAVNAITDVLEAAQTPQLAMTKGNPTFIEGKIPVAESELIDSLTVDGAEAPETYGASIAGLEIGDVMTFAWTAPYALRIELGYEGTDSLGRTYNVAGRHFVGKNAERFSDFVAARVKEVRK